MVLRHLYCLKMETFVQMVQDFESTFQLDCQGDIVTTPPQLQKIQEFWNTYRLAISLLTRVDIPPLQDLKKPEVALHVFAVSYTAYIIFCTRVQRNVNSQYALVHKKR